MHLAVINWDIKLVSYEFCIIEMYILKFTRMFLDSSQY